MIRTKEQKQNVVTGLVTRLRRSPTVYVTDFTGLNVAKLTDLRRKLRAAGVEYVVVKNTLARRALLEAQVSGLELHLTGATALVLGGADGMAAAKVLTDFAKEHQKPAIKGALVEGFDLLASGTPVERLPDLVRGLHLDPLTVPG